jgi:phage regulator Rha-like protein/phage antirepressor YoqD-like protein
MKELKIVNSETMTVYEIAKLVEYKSQHKDAMKICETLLLDDKFKGGDSPLSLESVTYGLNGQTVMSYALNKRQSFALASRLNVAFLMNVIDRWQELENKVKDVPLTGLEMAKRNVKLYEALDVAEKARIESERKALAKLESIGNHLAGSTIGKLGNNIMFNQAAKILATNLDIDLGHNRLMRLCRDHGWLMSGKRSKDEHNIPTQSKIHHFKLKVFYNIENNISTITPVLTVGGLVAITKLVPHWYALDIEEQKHETPTPQYVITHDCKDINEWLSLGWTLKSMVDAGHARMS